MADFTYYGANRLHRGPELFLDPAVMESRLHDRAARIYPVWRNRNLILDGDSPYAVGLTGDHARGLLEIAGEVALLGVETGAEGGAEPVACFAADVSEHELPALTPVMGRAEFLDLRQVGVLMDPHDGSLLSHARGLLYWHRHNGFCGDCGGRTRSAEAGRMRRCANDACGRDHFPRTDPAVIMLVTRPGPEGGACLLGRHRNLPPGIYSTLAGFVDQGETLEQAVMREVFEETGVRVEDVQYRGSQPWPFPASLMMGFRARAVSVAIDLGADELEDARWFTRDQVHGMENRGIRLPRRDSIAFQLIDEWLKEG